jgi:tRNA 5-methylaminomethyl-2-thiouridine biosynthesis bifunctional protein
MRFDDIYFSREGGFAEKNHVFIAGNNLPARWVGRNSFTIAETGFGTGLNFLSAWTVFERTARPGQKLHYISIEKYPLSWDEIFRAIAPWRQEFGGRIDRLRTLYPLRVPGFHRIIVNEQVTLTLIFDDVNKAMPQFDTPHGVDAWFLDGFAPAKNLDMWTERVFMEMSRLSAEDATFATYTVAGAVKRGLEAAGFTVEKKPGFGRKNEMLGGRFTGKRRSVPNAHADTGSAAIIGGGLAGTAAAFVLKRQGFQPVIFEAGAALASGASGNSLGLINPRLSARRTVESDFYTASFAQAVRTLYELQRGHNIEFNPCGSLHLLTDPEREKRLCSADANWGWHKSHMHLMDTDAASRRAGIDLAQGALALPDAGTVNPAALCAAYADGVERRLNSIPDIASLQREFDHIILACGMAVKQFQPLADLPVHTVRGQITHFAATEASAALRTNICFGGYLSPAENGLHTTGATFKQWDGSTAVTTEDHTENITRLREALPQMEDIIPAGGRAALRTSSKDRFPIIGHVSENAYVSTAHGSHGIISTLAGAHLLSDMITGAARSLPRDSIDALSPGRFATRAAKKQKL